MILRPDGSRGGVDQPPHARQGDASESGCSDDAAVALVRMDMHAHSRASSGPVTPALGLIGVPESYSPPEKVYEQARARGMSLVTLTDHDTIEGAMELVERGFAGVVVGEEVTVHFPEDRCALHVLVWGLTPEQHEAISALRLREDVYAFAAWLRSENLAHALAHPLYAQNGRLERSHLERCTLLFRAFETLNGAHAAAHRATLERWLALQTPATINELSKKHGIEPVWPRAWLKPTTAGSDDHALLNVGRTYTEAGVERGADPAAAFLRAVMAGRGIIRGQEGSSSLLAHQLSAVAMGYVAQRVDTGRAGAGTRRIVSRLAGFAGVSAERPGRLSLLADALKQKARRRRASALARALRETLAPALERHPEIRSRLAPEEWRRRGPAMADHERIAAFAQDVGAGLARFLASDAVRNVRRRDTAGALDAAAGWLVAALAQAPYIFGLFHQNKERPFLERLEREMDTMEGRKSTRPMRVSLFTDTLGDVNGVCRFIRNVAERARATGRDLDVITSTRMAVPEASNIYNFEPTWACRMPKYDQLEIAAPPLLRILRHVDRHQPDAIHISTPGPVGLIGFLAARMLRVPVLGVYHTDFPAYVDRLFEDEGLTRLCRGFMRMFYGPFHTVFTRSEDYARSLESLGLERGRTRTLPAGVDVATFHPRHRDDSVWARIGLTGVGGAPISPTSVKALYVGRVSVEKNLPMLTRAWWKARERIARSGREAELIVVGDGPYREAMARSFASAPGGGGVRFLGFRHGLELSQVYASSDFFLFPSTTDTLGQVVLESQASGLPVVVTEMGGPKEVVDEGLTGFVVPAKDEGAWTDAIVRLATGDEERRRMGRTAHVRAQRRSLEASFEHFWGTHEEAWKARRAELDGRRADADGPTPVVRPARPESTAQTQE